MAQTEKVTGIDPATWIALPSLRPVIVAVAGRVTPCIVSSLAVVRVIVAPEANAVPVVTGRHLARVATAWEQLTALFGYGLRSGAVRPGWSRDLWAHDEG